MKKNTKQTLLNIGMTIVFVTLFAWLPVATVGAQTSTTTTTGGGGRVQDGLTSIGGAFPSTVVAKDSTVSTLAVQVINIALFLAAILAVIFIIIGGYQYIFSAGSEEGAKKGRTTLMNALIGLVIIILSYVVVEVVYNFLTNKT